MIGKKGERKNIFLKGFVVFSVFSFLCFAPLSPHNTLEALSLSDLERTTVQGVIRFSDLVDSLFYSLKELPNLVIPQNQKEKPLYLVPIPKRAPTPSQTPTSPQTPTQNIEELQTLNQRIETLQRTPLLLSNYDISSLQNSILSLQNSLSSLQGSLKEVKSLKKDIDLLKQRIQYLSSIPNSPVVIPSGISSSSLASFSSLSSQLLPSQNFL